MAEKTPVRGKVLGVSEQQMPGSSELPSILMATEWRSDGGMEGVTFP